VVYYYAYGADGVRKGPWSTNCQTITEVRNFIYSLIRNGVLIPDRQKVLTFGEYAAGFWDGDSEWVKHRRSRKDVTDKYIAVNKRLEAAQITPFFGPVPLGKITGAGVDKWLLGFKDRGAKDKKTGEIKGRYKNSYANAAFRTLNTMLEEAARRAY
jgi:hypothetical protein